MPAISENLTGPFVVSYYDTRKHTLYLKKESGEWTSTVCYPALFIDPKDEKKFPFDEYGKYIIGKENEGSYIRLIRDPEMDRDILQSLVYTCRDENVMLYEADVTAIRRWFSDTGALVSQKFRSLYFDLETDPLKIGFDDDAKKQHRVISFAAYDEDGNKFFDCAKESSEEEERQLLKRFIKLIADYDTILAWNGDNYDFFVLRARCKRHGIKVDWRDWNLLDHMRVVKKVLMSVSDADFKKSFALDVIGETLLGLRKIKLSVAPGKMKLLLKDRVEELKTYNMRDVEIMYEIEKKKEFLKLHYAICSMCRTFPNRGSIYPNELADGMLLRFAIQENRHFPTRDLWINHDDDRSVKYEGAYVMNPIVGFHTNIQVPDFASLYPSIIRSFNMSTDTVLEPGKIYSDFNGEYAQTPATGVAFRTDFEGIIPKALGKLIAKRNEYKAKAKQYEVGSDEYNNTINLSTAVKVVSNSFYGLIGNEGSRYHNQDVAKSITLTAQLLIRKVINYFNSKQYQTVYGDSVAGDRVTIVKDKGITKVIRFSELWNLSINRRYYRGTKEIADFEDMKTLGRGPDGESGFFDVKHIIRHIANKKLYKIRTGRGETEVTADHSLFWFDDPCSVSDLISKYNLGFYWINPPVTVNNGIIDLYFYVKDKVRRIKISNKFHEYKFVPVTVDGVDYIMLDLGSHRKQHMIKRYITNEDTEYLQALLLIVALYLSGGVIKVDDPYRIKIKFKHKYKSTMQELYGAKESFCSSMRMSNIVTKKNTYSQYYYRYIESTTLSVFMGMMCEQDNKPNGSTKRERSIPSFIYDLRKNDVKYFYDKLTDFRAWVWGYIRDIASRDLRFICQCAYLMGIADYGKYYRFENVWTKTSIPSYWWMVGKCSKYSRLFSDHSKHIVEIRNPLPGEYVYDLDVPESRNFVDAFGCILLHNTDSVFVKSTEEQMEEEIKYINAVVIPEFLESVGCKTKEVKLEYDKGFKTLLLVSKKRYVGKLSLSKGRHVNDTLPPEIKGLETQRGDNIRYAQRLMQDYIPHLINSDTRPIDIDQKLLNDCDLFYNKKHDVSDIEISQSVKSNPDAYKVKGPHVKVAEQMIAEGMEFFPGMKIPYVIIKGEPTISAVHSSKYNGTIDKRYYWEHKILPSITRLLDARFPGYPFSNFKSPGQIILDFSNDNTVTYRSPNMTLKQIKKPTECKRRIPNATITITEDDRTEIMRLISDMVKSYRGDMPVVVIVTTNEAEIKIRTNEFISSQGLAEIKRLFPQLNISPNPT